MKQMMMILRQWFKRIKLALSLHPELDAARRSIMFGVVAVVAAGMISQVPEFMPEIGVVPKFDYVELTQVVRRAFLPRLHVQLWKSPPLIELLA